jgi:hypothetical protein
VIVTVCLVSTVAVVIGNEALVDPADTVTLAGVRTASTLLLSSLIVAPPEGAAAVSMTVPVGEVWPTTELDERVTDDSVAGAAGGGGVAGGVGAGAGAGVGAGAGAAAAAGAGVGDVGVSSSPPHPAAAKETTRSPKRTSTPIGRTAETS